MSLLEPVLPQKKKRNKSDRRVSPQPDIVGTFTRFFFFSPQGSTLLVLCLLLYVRPFRLSGAFLPPPPLKMSAFLGVSDTESCKKQNAILIASGLSPKCVRVPDTV